MRKIQKIMAGIFLGGVLLGGIGTGMALVEYSSLTYTGKKVIGQENLVVRELDYTFVPGQEQVTIVKNYLMRDAVLETDDAVPEGTIRYVVTYNEKTVRPSLSFWEEEPEAWEDEEIQESDWPEEDYEEAAGDGTEIRELQGEDLGGGEVQGVDLGDGQPEGGEVQGDDSENGQSEADESENGQQKPKRIGLCLDMNYISSDFSLLMESKDEILAGLKEKKIFDYQVAYITDVRILVNPLSRSSIEGDFAGYPRR